MTTRIILGTAVLWAAALTLSAPAAEREAEPKLKLRAVVELKDGSRLVGVPLDRSWRVTVDAVKTDIPLERIRSCEVRPTDERIILQFQNSDKLAGVAEEPRFRLETALGPLTPPFAQITRITFTTSREGKLPAGEGAIFFGGVNWQPWRTQFEVPVDKLVTLPKVRPGFAYGHGGGMDAARL